jgi:hypothetical protein
MDFMDDVLDLKDSLLETWDKETRKARRVLRGESGFSTLIVVLVILALGAIIITPLLVFVITGQRAGTTHNEVTDRLYAADTGIQDGMWRVQNDELPSWMLGTWGGSVYDQSYVYSLPNQVNDKNVSVTLRGVWLLDGLESMKNGREPHAELVTVGNVMRSGEYKIVIMDTGIVGNYKLERIGVWLPAGFTYTPGSSNLEKLPTTDPAYLVPTVSDWKNGHTIIWDYDASAKKTVLYTDLPAETATRRVITFKYTPGGSMDNAFSWCRTNRNDIYLSWSGDLKQFQIESTATNPDTGLSTTVIAANMKNEGVSSGMAVNGDYVATGNALIRDQNDDTFKERLYEVTPGTVSGVPDGGTARKILFYWSGWKAFPLNAWYEHTADWTAWTPTNKEQLQNLVPNYKVDKVSLTVKIGTDEYYLPSVQADSWQVVPNTDISGDENPAVDPWSEPNGWFYSCYADVTDRVDKLLRDSMTEEEYAALDFNGNATYIVGHAQESTSMSLDDVMQGVWGSSASDVYVVGDSGTVIHYNGVSWSTVASGATSCSLKSVWGSSTDNVWAVGDRLSKGGNDYRYTILHSIDNGSTWSDLQVANGQNLKSIWGSSATDIWAVGDAWKSGKNNYYTILHTTNGGTSWANTATVGTTTPQTLRSIWGTSENNVYAVGSSGTILRYNGTAWASVTSGTTNTLNGVWGVDSNHIWAVGSSGTILYYNGTSWSSGPPWTRPSGYSDVTLYGVWGTGGTDWAGGDRVYAVGYDSDDRKGVVWYYDGGSEWHYMNSGTSRALYGAWGSAQNSIYAVGEGTTQAGTLLYYDGVDDNSDGSLWDPTTGGTQMYGYNATNHAAEVVVGSTDYPLGDPGSTYGPPNYQVAHAAWSILVIYTSPETKGHQLYFYDTLTPSGRYNTKTFEIEGFLAPASVATEADAARITCFVGEGDQRVWSGGKWVLDGDNIYLNNIQLNTQANGQPSPSNDVWNGRSTEGNQDGIDIDTFYISGASGCIEPGDSEATVKFVTAMDRWNMVYMILSLRSDLSGTGLLSYIVK